MRIKSLLLGASALLGAMFGASAPMGAVGTVISDPPIGGPTKNRSGGSLAHRKWRKLRSSGRR